MSDTIIPAPEDASDWTDLRRHWVASAAAERTDPARAQSPAEHDNIAALWSATEALRALGWEALRSCPEGTEVCFVTLHSTGTTRGHREGHAGWWAHECGDLWPVQPIMWKPVPADNPATPPQEQ